MTTLTFTWRENIVQEHSQNTMLQLLQLIKPKKSFTSLCRVRPLSNVEFLMSAEYLF